MGFFFFLKDYSAHLTNFFYDIISVYIPKDPTLVVPKHKGGDGGAVGVDNVRLWKHQEQLNWQSQLISLDQSVCVCVCIPTRTFISFMWEGTPQFHMMLPSITKLKQHLVVHSSHQETIKHVFMLILRHLNSSVSRFWHKVTAGKCVCPVVSVMF